MARKGAVGIDAHRVDLEVHALHPRTALDEGREGGGAEIVPDGEGQRPAAFVVDADDALVDVHREIHPFFKHADAVAHALDKTLTVAARAELVEKKGHIVAGAVVNKDGAIAVEDATARGG